MQSKTPSLIIFSGLPGVGKTTLAKCLAEEIQATYLRVDSIEQALKRSMLKINPAQDTGYQAAFCVAQDNLQLMQNVIIDAVNPLNIIRNKWADIAHETKSEIINIEVICSDKTKHKKRIEERVPDIKDHDLPSWNDVIAIEYEAWNALPITIDTANTNIETAYKSLLCRIN